MTARPIFFGMARWNPTSLAAKKHEELDCRVFCQSANSITAADNVILPARRRQHWLEHDPVAFAVLLIGIGFAARLNPSCPAYEDAPQPKAKARRVRAMAGAALVALYRSVADCPVAAFNP